MFARGTSPLKDPRFATCFANAATGLAVVDLNGVLVDVNPAFCRISGYCAEEISCIGMEVFVEDESRKRFHSMLVGEIPGYVTERRYLRRDGSCVWARVSVSPIFDSEQRPEAVMAIMEDVSEKKLLEERALQSHKMEALGRLAGGVAHDFNNLLMIINSYASMLREELGETAASRRAQAIEEAGTRAAVLTSQLLAFSRKQVLLKQRIVLDDLLRASEPMLRRLVREDIEFDLRLDAAAASIEADYGQLQQVLMNLVGNASDAMPRGGHIYIASHLVDIDHETRSRNGTICCGQWLRLSVRDTGMGMDTATRERIFEPFFTTKGPGKGTGLGLATVFGIIEQSGGHISVDSELGDGTEFIIHLPLATGGVEYQSPMPIAQPALRRQIRATVLLVEDEQSLRQCMASTLAAMGCYVIEASNGRDALEIARRQMLLIDMVVTDIVMPAMGGIDLVKELRQMRPSLPVLFMSGYAGAGQNSEELRSVNTDFFQKPFTSERLRRAVEEMLSTVPAHPRPVDTAAPVS